MKMIMIYSFIHLNTAQTKQHPVATVSTRWQLSSRKREIKHVMWKKNYKTRV